MHPLRFLPVSLFASVMGLTGLAIAYQRFEQVFQLEVNLGNALLVFAGLVFAGLATAYGYKTIRYFPAVAQEFRHPVQGCFFAAISISLLLLSIGALDINRELSRCLWLTGSLLHVGLTLTIFSGWLGRQQDIAQACPAWFLPTVGNIIVPIAGTDFAGAEVAWVFFSIGAFFGLMLFTVLFYRVVFLPPLPDKLLPTLFIFIAPPALGFLAYTRLTGTVDGLARTLLYATLLLVLLLLLMARSFLRLNFTVSWWAYTFPLCAATTATITAFRLSALWPLGWLAGGLIALTTLIVGVVFVNTVKAIAGGRLYGPS